MSILRLRPPYNGGLHGGVLPPTAAFGHRGLPPPSAASGRVFARCPDSENAPFVKRCGGTIYIYIYREREREREIGVMGSPERDISSPDSDGAGVRQISGVVRASDALLGCFPQLF